MIIAGDAYHITFDLQLSQVWYYNADIVSERGLDSQLRKLVQRNQILLFNMGQVGFTIDI